MAKSQKNIVETLTDLELFLVSFGDLYSLLEIGKIIKQKEDFSDHLFNNSSNPMKLHRVEYITFRTRVLFDLYNFARNNDASLVKKPIRWIKRKLKF